MQDVKRWFPVLVGGVFIAFSIFAHAAEQKTNAEDLLAAMISAKQSLNYQGTVVVYKNDNLETLKFSHIANANGETQEHAIALNSPLREVIRNPEKVVCIYAEAHAMIVDHLPLQRSFLIDFPASADILQSNYAYQTEGEETIALLPADIVLIKPKDQYRYARRIWIGKSNHLPLKYELLNDEGSVLEQIAFTELQVKPALASSFIDLETYNNPRLTAQHINELQQLPIEEAGFTLQNIPSGFEPAFFTRRKMHDGGDLVEHMVLKDGLASVSIYVEQQSDPQPKVIKAAGAISSFSIHADEHLITVMGDVPLKAVKFIAEGIKLKNLRR